MYLINNEDVSSCPILHLYMTYLFAFFKKFKDFEVN